METPAGRIRRGVVDGHRNGDGGRGVEGHVEAEIKGVEQNGNTDSITYPEAITGFRDEGAHVWAMAAMRVQGRR